MKSTNNMLNLNEIFSKLESESYVIIKLDPNFPKYNTYSDIDIFAADPANFSRKILSLLNQYVERGGKVEVSNNDTTTHIQIDFYKNVDDAKLDYKFDIWGEFPRLKKVSIKDAYFYSILEQKGTIKKTHNKVSYNLYVPSELDENITRYLEYIEYYEQRPDKIKHLDYVLKNLTEETSLEFFNRLHLYTKLNLLEVPADSHFGRSMLQEYNEGLSRTEKGIVDVKIELAQQQEGLEVLSRETKELKTNVKSVLDFTNIIRGSSTLRYILRPGQLPKAIVRKIKRLF